MNLKNLIFLLGLIGLFQFTLGERNGNRYHQQHYTKTRRQDNNLGNNFTLENTPVISNQFIPIVPSNPIPDIPVKQAKTLDEEDGLITKARIIPNSDEEPQSHAEARGGLSLDKSPPDLQFGLAFTVPFISLSTERLISGISGKSGFGDPFSDISSLLKLNVGGLVLGGIVALGAFLFFPALLPGVGKFSSLFPTGLVQNFLESLGLGGWNKPFGYGQYDQGNGYNYPSHADFPWNSIHGKGIERKDPNERGRSIDGESENNNRERNGTFWGEIVSKMHKTVKIYFGEFENCVSHAMCLRGRKDIINEKLKDKKEEEDEQLTSEEEEEKKLSQRNIRSRRVGRAAATSSNQKQQQQQYHLFDPLSSLDHILEAVQGMKGTTENFPVFNQLHKAYQMGQGGINCKEQFKKCSLDPKQFSNMINSMGNYVFN